MNQNARWNSEINIFRQVIFFKEMKFERYVPVNNVHLFMSLVSRDYFYRYFTGQDKVRRNYIDILQL